MSSLSSVHDRHSSFGAPSKERLRGVAAACFVLLTLTVPWKLGPMTIAAIATAVLTLGLWWKPPRPRWPDAPVGRAWAAWAVALVVAAIFALDPLVSAIRLNKALLPGLIALAAFHTPDRRSGRRTVALLLASSAVAAVYGIGFFVAHGASFHARARGAVGHYMTFAGQLLLCLGPTVGIALLAREWRWRIGAGLAAIVQAVALAATFTRSSWLGLVAALVVIAGAIRPRWVLGLAVVLVAGYFVAPGAIQHRVRSVVDPHDPTNLERTYMWEAGLRMFRDHPITGVGLEDLHPIYARYKLPQATEPAGHLHSVPVQIAATMGIVGLAAFAFLYFSLLRCAWTGLRPMLRAGGVEAGLRLGVLAALVGFLVAGLFEWNFGDEELLYILYPLVGLAWSARTWVAPRLDVVAAEPTPAASPPVAGVPA